MMVANAAPLPLPSHQLSPYKGLIPYSEADAAFFFGRDAERDVTIANLMASRLTLLYGESGVGKSSLVRAASRRTCGTRRAKTCIARDRPNPVSWSSIPGATIRWLHWLTPPRPPPRLPGKWRRARCRNMQSGSLVDAFARAADTVEGSLVVILDQFEEYFLYHPDEDGPGTFAYEFPQALASQRLNVSFLLAIREDALAKLDRFDRPIPNVFGNYLRIEHLDRAAGRLAIEQPVVEFNRLNGLEGTAASISIEPELVEAVLDEVKIGRVMIGEHGRGAIDGANPAMMRDDADRIETPYLQLVMSRLWGEDAAPANHAGAGVSVLRLATLQRLGGAERIVRSTWTPR